MDVLRDWPEIRDKYTDIQFIADITGGAITEPITKAELKDYLKLQGFVGASGTVVAFTADDAIMDIIIKACREQFEKECNLTLTATRSLTARVNNFVTAAELPYGPVSAVTAIVDSEGTAISIVDIDFRDGLLYSPFQSGMLVTYTAGYGTTGLPTLPASIKLDLLRASAYYYIHRGDDQAVEKFVSTLATKYRRGSWLQ